MKNKLLIIAAFLLSHICTAFAENATLSISNSSDYYLTVKIMKYGGGLYTTLYIPAKQTSTAYFSKTGWFYTKTKAEKSNSSTLYRKDYQPFEMVCDHRGYSQNSMTYYISEGGGSAGKSISKSEFEKDN